MCEQSYMLSGKAVPDNLHYKNYDVVIIGAGIAGMAAALSMSPKLKIALVSKESMDTSSTYKAQGGMAVAVGHDDSPEAHITDTLRVGQGLCRRETVETMVREGTAALEFLQSLGMDFACREGDLFLTKEGGHSRRRIVHYYDYTGRHIAETMAGKIVQQANIDRLEKCFLLDVLVKDNQSYGCTVLCDGNLLVLRAGAVVIASGGYSGLFARSTNIAATGDGIAAAYRAGAAIADMEFVQFHPTTVTTSTGEVFLLTEALRGEGAFLRNAAGERFMFTYHHDGELAPRDIVSQAITAEMKKDTRGVVYLDARHLGQEYLADRFRQVYSMLAQNGYFMEQDLVPIAPAAHYTIGGILTNEWGKTTVDNLYACGEAAATGVHGANRLASNSLLEGVVFGRRVAWAISQGSSRGSDSWTYADFKMNHRRECWIDSKILGKELSLIAGVVRNGADMKALLERLHKEKNQSDKALGAVEYQQGCNSYILAELLLQAAMIREESRGTHYRADYPQKNDLKYKLHIIQQRGRKARLQ